VGWNFEKFLIGKNGQLLSRFGSGAEPEGAEIEAAVKKELGQP
jgi:glutathione peroxidase